MDDENLIEKILDGLDDEYKFIVDVIEECETLISFDELHEKMINKELLLCTNQYTSSSLPTSENPTHTTLILETTNQVSLGHHGCHPLHLLSCPMAPRPPLKMIALLIVFIWVNVKVVEYKDIQLNNILFIGYCH